MATLLKRANSPFWFLLHKVNGKWKKSTTGLRRDSPRESNQAQQIAAAWTTKELKIAGENIRPGGWDWVEDFFATHCQTRDTRLAYTGAWRNVSAWLREKDITSPEKVRYEHAAKFIKDRTTKPGARKKDPLSFNTALQYFLIFSTVVMHEAFRREMVAANPLTKLGIARKPARRRDRLTIEQIKASRTELKNLRWPRWMSESFEIAVLTGCRLSETKIPMKSIDIEKLKITFVEPKGGEKRAFSTTIPDALVPLFRKMLADGRRVTCNFTRSRAAKLWRRFFNVLKLPHVTFHSLRITHINLLREAGLPREAVMRRVNHASSAVHQIYQREQFEDLLPYRNAVNL